MIDILICDDCSKTLEIIKNIVNEFYNEINFKDFNIITFTSYSSIISYIKKTNNLKIYILDIDLHEEKNGLLLGRDIRKLDNYLGEMIFVTNYSEMAYKVFQYKLRVLEFIDKNYNLKKELKESLSIAVNILAKSNKIQNEKKLQIKIASQIFNIKVKDIIYIETIKNSRKVALYTLESRMEFYSTLKELKASLNDDFIQIHKTTIVNKNHIKNICKHYYSPYIELINGAQCSLSRNGLKEVREHCK